MKKTKLSEEGCVGDLNTWLDLFTNDVTLNLTDTPVLNPNDFPIKNTRLEECFFEYFSSVVPTLLEGVNIKVGCGVDYVECRRFWGVSEESREPKNCSKFR